MSDNLNPPNYQPISKWSWIKLDLPLILVFIVCAWTIGAYVTTNSMLVAEINKSHELQQQINRLDLALRQLQEEQKITGKDTAETLSKINVQLAEIKGAATTTAVIRKRLPK